LIWLGVQRHGERLNCFTMRTFTPIDRLLSVADQSLRTIWGHHHAQRPVPRPESPAGDPLPELDAAEKRLSGALIRVDHVGEVCAQALYTAQALATRDEPLRAHLEAASQEETDHLAWTEQRLRELGARPSLLNPLWYAGAFAIGTIAARLGDRASLGFVIETERQVEEHLDSHLARLPAGDLASRAIVTQMRDDEIRHAEAAQQAGGVRPPLPVRWLMRTVARVMTTTAHRI
jgi:3-demethoxyubiquinol 3-hydroxylase